MSEPPRVSVLVPAFDAAGTIAQTLESVAAQDHPDLEVIVVDDGSRDATAAIAAGFSGRFARWHLVRQANRGQPAALNHALAMATGKYVQFLDADDVLMPGKIAAQVRRLEESPGAVATAAWGRFYDVPANTRFEPEAAWRDLAPIDWLVADWEDGRGMMFPAMWLVPADVARRAGPWREDLTLLCDTEYFPRVVLASAGVRFCADARVGYRSGHGGSVSARRSKPALESGFAALAACEERLLAAEDSARTRKVVSALWQRFAHGIYPFHPTLANEALRRGFALDARRLAPQGGRAFGLVSGLIGWKAARWLQRLATLG
jgi:glycosyltransferase involved in cell wall biosynthesis